MALFKNKTAFTIDVERKIIFLTMSGEISSKSIVELTKKILSDSSYDKSYDWLWDISKGRQLFFARKVDLFFDFFKKNSSNFQNVKMAFIISNPNHSISIDTLMGLNKEHSIKINLAKFIDMNSAMKWLRG